MISSLYHAVAEAWCFIKSNCNSSLDAVQIDVIHHEPHTLSLMPFKFFFQQSFIDFYICEVVSFYWAEQGIKLDCFASKIYYGNWKFYMKRNKKMQSNKLSRVGSIDWKSSLRSVSTPPWMRCLCIVRLPLLPHTPPPLRTYSQLLMFMPSWLERGCTARGVSYLQTMLHELIFKANF